MEKIIGKVAIGTYDLIKSAKPVIWETKEIYIYKNSVKKTSCFR